LKHITYRLLGKRSRWAQGSKEGFKGRIEDFNRGDKGSQEEGWEFESEDGDIEEFYLSPLDEVWRICISNKDNREQTFPTMSNLYFFNLFRGIQVDFSQSFPNSQVPDFWCLLY